MLLTIILVGAVLLLNAINGFTLRSYYGVSLTMTALIRNVGWVVSFVVTLLVLFLYVMPAVSLVFGLASIWGVFFGCSVFFWLTMLVPVHYRSAPSRWLNRLCVLPNLILVVAFVMAQGSAILVGIIALLLASTIARHSYLRASASQVFASAGQPETADEDALVEA